MHVKFPYSQIVRMIKITLCTYKWQLIGQATPSSDNLPQNLLSFFPHPCLPPSLAGLTLTDCYTVKTVKIAAGPIQTFITLN